MAGVGPSPAGKGRRKSLDAEVNLVPFIDLLSMCICFLLMTAVWMEVGAINVKQLVGTEASASSVTSYEMGVTYLTPQRLEITLKAPGHKNETFTFDGATHEERVARLRDFAGGLGLRLKLNPAQDLKAQMGQAISVARVTTKAGVSYGEIVSVMDTLRNVGIVNLGLVPVRE